MTSADELPNDRRGDVASLTEAYGALIGQAERLIEACENGITVDEQAIANYRNMIAELRVLVASCQGDLKEILQGC